MTAKAGTRAAKTRKPFQILEGVLPIVTARVPTEVIAALTLAALAVPDPGRAQLIEI